MNHTRDLFHEECIVEDHHRRQVSQLVEDDQRWSVFDRDKTA
jgi:hypothetical protein